jgi:hypothetical protein
LINDPDFVFGEEEVVWDEEEMEKLKPTWKINKQIERNLALSSKEEIENYLEIAANFDTWMEPILKKHNAKENNFGDKLVIRKVDEFVDKEGISSQELEEGFYLYKKNLYTEALQKWNNEANMKKNKKKLVKKIIPRTKRVKGKE